MASSFFSSKTDVSDQIREAFARELAKDLPYDVPDENVRYLTLSDWLLARHPEMLTDRGREHVAKRVRDLQRPTLEGEVIRKALPDGASG